jgi:hypothetical protein
VNVLASIAHLQSPPEFGTVVGAASPRESPHLRGVLHMNKLNFWQILGLALLVGGAVWWIYTKTR